MKCTSSSCSKAPTQHDAATHALHSWEGVLRLASAPLFPPNITIFIMAIFVSSDQRTFLHKVWSLSPSAVANHSLAFFYGFAVLEQWLLLCWATFQVLSIIGLVLLWIYSEGKKVFDPLLILYVCPLTKKLSVFNFNGRFIWTVRDRITTKKIQKTHVKNVINWFAF